LISFIYSKNLNASLIVSRICLALVSMIDDLSLPSKLLKVLDVDSDSGKVSAKLRDGLFQWFTVTSGILPEVGDIIFLSDQHWEQAPPKLWLPEARSIGVVRQLLDDGWVLIDDGIVVRLVSNPKSIKLLPLNTVQLDDDGISIIISETPIRSREFGNELINIEKEYRVDTTSDGPKFRDFGGYPAVVARARQLIDTQLKHRDNLEAIGARPVKGVLFTGPPGTGKTHLARIIAHESGAEFYLVSGPTIVSKWVGESEETLRSIFQMATSSVDKRAIIFFDEIDSIAEKRGGDTHEASRRLVAQLLTLMDGFDKKGNSVVVIAATNRIEALDPALTRPGRFDWEIEFGMPNIQDRYQILRVSASHLQSVGELPFEDLAQLTEGWSAAQLSSIWGEAALLAASENRNHITSEDASEAYERAAQRPNREMQL
jgi:transitional endoplasmic reticulum ATPase